MRPTVCCAIDILTASCSPLLTRDWRGGLPSDYMDFFTRSFKDCVHDSELPPTFPYKTGEYDYFHMRHGDLIFVCTGHKGTNPALVLSFMHKVVGILKYYFGRLEEESIRDNFVLIYELFDEIVDYGYPQFTEGNILQHLITLDAHRLEIAKVPLAMTNAISWRPEDILYAKNEVFLDVVESCSLCVNGFGEVTQASLHGVVQMKAQLSGMPECKLGLNDNFTAREGRPAMQTSQLNISDINFHRCVKLGEFSMEKNIVFVPPDGPFELLSYRIASGISPLLWVNAKRTTVGETKVKYTLRLSTTFKERFVAQDIKVSIPVESDATNPEIQCKLGEVVYVPESESINWTLKTLSGGKDIDLTLFVSVPSVKAENSKIRRRVEVHFEVPYLTPSGIQVRYLKVFEKSGYSALPWVRYLTRAGDYTFKISDGGGQ
ncbi:Mu homology domain-containing protein [Ostreococcus tauri]|uniref:Mu homology domain-containing protein n=1 Tax=Ostreococcus tauri TaxID=70448 RepID=A0A1Y5HXC6_OSTTA|nr:Mu homology domain-containing protein [Ostreococcus tauri]